MRRMPEGDSPSVNPADTAGTFGRSALPDKQPPLMGHIASPEGGPPPHGPSASIGRLREPVTPRIHPETDRREPTITDTVHDLDRAIRGRSSGFRVSVRDYAPGVGTDARSTDRPRYSGEVAIPPADPEKGITYKSVVVDTISDGSDRESVPVGFVVSSEGKTYQRSGNATGIRMDPDFIVDRLAELEVIPRDESLGDEGTREEAVSQRFNQLPVNTDTSFFGWSRPDSSHVGLRTVVDAADGTTREVVVRYSEKDTKPVDGGDGSDVLADIVTTDHYVYPTVGPAEHFTTVTTEEVNNRRARTERTYAQRTEATPPQAARGLELLKERDQQLTEEGARNAQALGAQTDRGEEPTQ